MLDSCFLNPLVITPSIFILSHRRGKRGRGWGSWLVSKLASKKIAFYCLLGLLAFIPETLVFAIKSKLTFTVVKFL